MRLADERMLAQEMRYAYAQVLASERLLAHEHMVACARELVHYRTLAVERMEALTKLLAHERCWHASRWWHRQICWCMRRYWTPKNEAMRCAGRRAACSFLLEHLKGAICLARRQLAARNLSNNGSFRWGYHSINPDGTQFSAETLVKGFLSWIECQVVIEG